MTVRLGRHGDGWSGTDNGVTFIVRGVGLGAAAAELVESGRYLVTVSGLPNASGAELRTHGLVHRHVLQNGVLIASLELGHEFGDLQLQVFVAEHAVAEALVTVGARHLDVATDYVDIQRDLERVAHGLSYSIWKQAAQQAYPDFQIPSGTPEWLALLTYLWERMRRTLVAIERDPDQELRDVHEVVPASRAGSPDQRGLRWLAQHPDAWEAFNTPPPVASLPIAGKYLTATRALSRRREVSLDTAANRLLKAQLRRIERRITRVVASLAGLPAAHFAAGQRGVYRQNLLKILRESQRVTERGFLREVTDLSRPTGSSHVARADPRYRDVLRAAAMLQWGIVQGVGGLPMLMSQRETWELYEYWVYLYVLSVFDGMRWTCQSQSSVHLSADASIVIDLSRGSASTAQFQSPPGVSPARVATVTFHKVYASRDSVKGVGPGARSVERDVDIVVEVQAPGIIRRVALDPKYRAETTDDGCKVAPVSAINDMHVYRDSIGRWVAAPAATRRFETVLDAAIAVFPSHDEGCAATHRFCRSIADGVGALPLLPSAPSTPAALVQRFVERLATTGVIEPPSVP